MENILTFKNLMSTRKSSQQRHNFSRNPNSAVNRRGKSVERKFYIDFSPNNSPDEQYNSNFQRTQKEVGSTNYKYNQQVQPKKQPYSPYRKERLNYENYIIPSPPKTENIENRNNITNTATLKHNPKLIEKKSVKEQHKNPEIPILPKSKNRKTKRMKKNESVERNVRASSVKPNPHLKSVLFAQESFLTNDSSLEDDFLSENTSDSSQYGKEISPLPTKNRKMISDISELSDITKNSETQESDLHHHRKQSNHKHQHHHKHSNNSNQKRKHLPKEKDALQITAKFCESDDIAESFLDDSIIHTKSKSNQKENHKFQVPNDNDDNITNLISDIITTISKVQIGLKSKLQISDSLDIVINNPVIQNIRGNIKFPNVYVKLPATQTMENMKPNSKSKKKINESKPDTRIDRYFRSAQFGIDASKKKTLSRSPSPKKITNDPEISNDNIVCDQIKTNEKPVMKIESRNQNYMNLLKKEPNNVNQLKKEQEKPLMVKRVKKVRRIQSNQNNQINETLKQPIIPNNKQIPQNTKTKESSIPSATSENNINNNIKANNSINNKNETRNKLVIANETHELNIELKESVSYGSYSSNTNNCSYSNLNSSKSSRTKQPLENKNPHENAKPQNKIAISAPHNEVDIGQVSYSNVDRQTGKLYSSDYPQYYSYSYSNENLYSSQMASSNFQNNGQMPNKTFESEASFNNSSYYENQKRSNDTPTNKDKNENTNDEFFDPKPNQTNSQLASVSNASIFNFDDSYITDQSKNISGITYDDEEEGVEISQSLTVSPISNAQNFKKKEIISLKETEDNQQSMTMSKDSFILEEIRNMLDAEQSDDEIIMENPFRPDGSHLLSEQGENESDVNSNDYSSNEKVE
ncbi:hypothetical protein TRFO_25719 [Tritrichomonas foetus]|uniref:Uncharacterized protein n=1 Tax=Tritrichomonas foetus TaxID=1144522 RepID=A0A1J4K9X5_9EUKA|nr:hypothetical protein TRFO_25719 [Tritrichomonas foetus]|eukprot:OHT06245.1 hypothetical protein TRFO_25719 [Tritrichomonas foetus]